MRTVEGVRFQLNDYPLLFQAFVTLTQYSNHALHFIVLACLCFQKAWYELPYQQVPVEGHRLPEQEVSDHRPYGWDHDAGAQPPIAASTFCPVDMIMCPSSQGMPIRLTES